MFIAWKVGHFTLDNTLNNDSAMEKLAEILQEECECTFDLAKHHIQCFSHIVNICVQHTINKYMHTDFSNVISQWTNASRQSVNKANYVTAVQHDPLELGRECI